MKRYCIALLAALTICAGAADLTTKSGKVYKKYSVEGPTTAGLVIFYELGGATIPYADLPDDLRAKYKADEEKATVELKAQEEQRKKFEEQCRAEARKHAKRLEQQIALRKDKEKEAAKQKKKTEEDSKIQWQLGLVKRKLGKAEVVQILSPKGEEKGGVIAVPDFIFMHDADSYDESENESRAKIFIAGLDLNKRSDGEILGGSYNAYTILCWEIGFQNLEELDGTKRRLRKFTVNRDEAIQYCKKNNVQISDFL